MPQAHEDSSLSRRPARHRDRRRGGDHQWSEGGRQGHRRSEARGLGRWRGGAGLPEPARRSRHEAREHLRDGSGRRGLQGPHRTDGSGQGTVRPRNQRAHARRSDRRRGRVPRSLGRRRAQAGHGQADGREAADSRARQPDAGNPAGTRARSAPGRGAGDGPHGLSEPGQQRSVLPVHLPRGARRRRDRDHEGNGDRGCERDCGTGASGAERYRRDGLWHSGSVVRPRISDSEALRSASHRKDRAGRGEGRDGLRRGDASDRGHGRLRAASAAVRLSQRHDDEARVPARAQRRAGEKAHRVRGRRGRARAARGADRGR
ncbi:hypothetical protein AWB73_06862 [Caballeronia turbans]|nr:hypothetical protein AWB73_06862 [Caballeronia turbans]